MNTKTGRRLRCVALAGLMLVLVVIGSLFVVTALAAAAPQGTVASPAVPSVPDVGKPGEGTGQQLVPTIDPSGNPVWPRANDDRDLRDTAVRNGWTEVVSIVDGARIRTRPVTGTVIGLIPKGVYFYIKCQVRASDGYIWGYATHAGRYGWVREDLWDIVRYTAPGAPAPRPIPWC